jgi:hypothetical protein
MHALHALTCIHRCYDPLITLTLLLQWQLSVAPLLQLQGVHSPKWHAADDVTTPLVFVPQSAQHAYATCHNSRLRLQDAGLWACLAAMALEARELGAAEAALAATNDVDKLRMVVRLQALPSEESRSAELALLRHRPDEAEAILLQVCGRSHLCAHLLPHHTLHGEHIGWNQRISGC